MLKITEFNIRMNETYHYKCYPSVNHFMREQSTSYYLDLIGKCPDVEVYYMYQHGVSKPIAIVTVEQ
jgi:hypothetical protein